MYLGVGGGGIQADPNQALVLALGDAHRFANFFGFREWAAFATFACLKQKRNKT